MKNFETVTLNGQTYIVAVLREQDIAYLARRIAVELRRSSDAQVAAELDAEHRRQAPGFRHNG